jgi:uncharacterized protein YjaG (DUF416 family)
MSEETLARLQSLTTKKKLAFAVLLYERMIPELRSFTAAKCLDFSCFQRARDEFWLSLKDNASAVSWAELREDILNASPDSESFSCLAASFGLNAALVGAAIAGFLADGRDSHLIEAVGYARDSLDANANSENGTMVHNKEAEDYVTTHPLVQRERKAEERDIAFLSAMQDAPWSAEVFSALRRRAETQSSLIDKTYP